MKNDTNNFIINFFWFYSSKREYLFSLSNLFLLLFLVAPRKYNKTLTCAP